MNQALPPGTTEPRVQRIALMSSARSIPDLFAASASRIFDLHGGNTGNVAFVNAIASHLSCKVTHVSWGAPPAELRAAGEVLVIACANQLGPHTDLGRTGANIEGAGVPVLALGLGAQANSSQDDTTIQPGTRRWLEVISALRPGTGPNIGVRGEYTLTQLERLGFPDCGAVIGCPSNFTNLAFDFVSDVEKRSSTPTALVAAAIGLPFDAKLGPVEREILDLVDATEGTCIVQHGLSMLQLACAEFDGISAGIMEQSRRYFRPKLGDAEFRDWCRKRLVVFGDADNWMNWLKRYDFVVGPRFHGVMLALQAGIPAGCIAHDSRTLEMCVTMGVPVRDYDSFDAPLTLDNLKQQFPFDAAAYRAKRGALAETYTRLLRSAGVPYRQQLDAELSLSLAS